jgi:hypothetical protein
MSAAMGTIQGFAKAGDLKTLWARSRSETRTTNLQGMSVGTLMLQRVFSYLWNTETQLSGPLAHWLRYESNFGCNACKKGPMNGILNDGPAIEPFRLMYMTGFDVQSPKNRFKRQQIRLTLIISNKYK